MTLWRSEKVLKIMDFEFLRGSMGNAGIEISLETHIEHKCSTITICYDKLLPLIFLPLMLFRNKKAIQDLPAEP